MLLLRSRTAPVTPRVIATPKAMSETSALRSVLSALSAVGRSSKSFLSDRALMPKMVPTAAPTPAIPRVTYAGTLERGLSSAAAGGGADVVVVVVAAGAAGGGVSTGAGGGGSAFLVRVSVRSGSSHRA